MLLRTNFICWASICPLPREHSQIQTKTFIGAFFLHDTILNYVPPPSTLQKKKNPNQINYMIIWKNQCVNCGAKSIFRFFNGKWDCEIVVCLLSIHLCDITKDLENMLVQTIFSSNANHIICWQQIAVKLWSGTVWNVKK